MTISINGEPVPTTRFPDNTVQVWKVPEAWFQGEWVTVRWDYENASELMELAQLKMLLDANHVEAYLDIPYLPYARQDKAIANDATFALRSFTKLLNTLNFYEVSIMDPHSAVATQLIDNAIDLYPHAAVYKAWVSVNAHVACYPDRGAMLKYEQKYGLPYISAVKVREPLTGTITGITLQGDCRRKNVLIVDDICDGGRTFIGVAEELYRAGARKVSLFVTHGIFSQGLEPLLSAGISRIFTKNGEV